MAREGHFVFAVRGDIDTGTRVELPAPDGYDQAAIMAANLAGYGWASEWDDDGHPQGEPTIEVLPIADDDKRFHSLKQEK